MVKLRFARFGRKNLPFYRLVAIQSKTKREGEAIEYLGQYDPKKSPSAFTMNEERVKYWLSVGAQPTETVRGFLAKGGLLKNPKRDFNKRPGKKRSAQLATEATKKEQEKEAAAAQKEADKAAAAAPVEEPKAEEVVAEVAAQEATEAAPEAEKTEEVTTEEAPQPKAD